MSEINDDFDTSDTIVPEGLVYSGVIPDDIRKTNTNIKKYFHLEKYRGLKPHITLFSGSIGTIAFGTFTINEFKEKLGDILCNFESELFKKANEEQADKLGKFEPLVVMDKGNIKVGIKHMIPESDVEVIARIRSQIEKEKWEKRAVEKALETLGISEEDLENIKKAKES